MIRISRLSLRNFKSFKRVSIPIPEGFTAIVGPNGSGKSNIIDAICFVLGRSSAKSLRAERFSDLIFNGGKKGKPADKAEVTLYLDNSGMEIPGYPKEIKISRSIDISGNSVYKLNGRRTTRTEILEILSAAKIQPNGHNIVLQGDITRIIEMSPIERRAIIDEIAGIAEYDEKKRKALRELEKTSNNLSKINAVVHEVKEQLQKLEKEKRDALRHEYLKREIRITKGTVLYSHKLEVEEELEKIHEELKSFEDKKKKIEKFLNVLNVKIEVKKRELENINNKIVVKEETEKFSIFKNIEKIKNEIKYFEEKVNSLKQEIKNLREEQETIATRIQETEDQIKEYRSENKRLSAEEEELEKKIEEVKEKVEAEYKKLSYDEESTQLQEKLEKIRIELEEKREKLLEIEKDRTLLLEKKTEKERIFKDLKDELDEKKKKIKDIDEKLSNISEKIERLKEEIKKEYIKKKELTDKDVELKREIEKISTLLQLKAEKFERLNARYEALEKISQKRLSFNNAVDAILELRDKGKVKGIHGTVSELGRVNQKYSKALEIAAGGGLTFIIVDDDETAETCINYLKEKRIGRATFLPLNRIKASPPSEKAVNIAKKSYGFAIDLVDFDEKYREAFAYIFRNTVVVKDVKFARRMGIGDVRMVTLDGDLIEPSGSMSGGFYKPTGVSFEEVDTTKREIDALRQEINSLEVKRRELMEKEGALRDEIEKTTLLLDQKNREIENLSAKMEGLKEEKETLINFVVKKEALANDIYSSLRDLSSQISRDEKEIELLSRETSTLTDEKDSIEEGLRSSSAEEVLNEIRVLESQIQSLEKEREERRSRIRLNNSKISEILEPRISSLKNELRKNETLALEKESQIKKNQEKIETLQESLSNLKDRENEFMESINGLKDRREFLVRGIKRMQDKIEELKAELAGIDKKMEICRIDEARLTTKLEGIKEDLKEYADLDIELLAPIDTAELEKEIVKMEYEMSSLEPINMRAVEDYKIVKEKYDKLNSKVEKLMEEMDALHTLMEEIEHRKKSIFMEVFENIAMNFRRIFSQLSDGGSADLLLDEDNPLEGGLMIKAKPPGKNPQYIELMSGGEKTLTALSFIFAIQRYQPAPFYVMDEIDMFLDDDNIRKVSELIKESSKDAQFIVVSLRDNLMTSASQLFGVSIEDGVSKIVGVELEEVAS
jgi:chromosome segregation protein